MLTICVDVISAVLICKTVSKQFYLFISIIIEINQIKYYSNQTQRRPRQSHPRPHYLHLPSLPAPSSMP